ncbi:glucose-6-phosphate isomerase [Halalkalibacter nanhaiisediminis]|uniref:Glucose-6-phosphate isomerase n=1 Tax=Halalkalibacter nanhaiisediminis TaxID=688079 RepID=A0A562QN16_9BACI|nr:glucose-6-phosphate isomerase [Halalkalibacter nanhaiisediminis]
MNKSEMNHLSELTKVAHEMIYEKKGQGSDYLGWVDLPLNYDKEEFARVKDAASRIRSHSDALIVIGIGGSYLGARSAIEALSHSFHNQIEGYTEVYYAGQNISSTYLTHLFE